MASSMDVNESKTETIVQEIRDACDRIIETAKGNEDQ